MNTDHIKPCPSCDSENLYIDTRGHAPASYPGMLLQGIDRKLFFSTIKLHAVICQDCGHTRLFANDSAREKLKTSKRWKKI